jgi:hypothetical protein
MMMFSMFSTLAPVLAAICESDLVWSNLVIPVKFFFGIEGALVEAIKQLVLQGLPTTTTFTVFLATLSRAAP